MAGRVGVRRKAVEAPTIERKVHFYRVSRGTVGGKPKPADLRKWLAAVNGLSDDDWYYTDGEGNATCCWVDQVGSMSKLRFARVRRSGLPQVERKRNLTALNLAADSGLAEQIHVVLFPDGIAGAEFNFYGPGMSRLSAYLREKVDCEGVSFEPLLRRDVMQQLNQFGHVRVLQLQVNRQYAQIVASASRGLGSALRGALEATGGQEIEVVIKPTKHSREFLGDGVLPLVKRLAGRQDLRENAGRFLLRGLNDETGKMETVDVLRDLLIASERVRTVGDRTRAVVSSEMYAGIENAYDRLRNQLETAASLS